MSDAWETTTRDRPCQACGKFGWCRRRTDKPLTMCRYIAEGSRKQKEDKTGAPYYLHWFGESKPPKRVKRARKQKEDTSGKGQPAEPAAPTRPRKTRISQVVKALEEASKAPDRIEKLKPFSEQLTIPMSSLLANGAVVGKRGELVLPRRNAKGLTVSFTQRDLDGTKRSAEGLPAGFPYIPEKEWGTELLDVFVIPEGDSDTMVLHGLGYPGLGRHSNMSNAEDLAEILGRRKPAEIYLLGENDEKPDGSHPGRDGALAVAKKIATILRLIVYVAFPPAGFKDVRSWVQSQIPPLEDGAAWRRLGLQFREHLRATRQSITPGKRTVVVVHNESQTVAEAGAALADDPYVFRMGSTFVRLALQDDGSLLSVPCTADYLRMTITQYAEVMERVTIKLKGGGEKEELKPCFQPAWLSRGLLADPVRHHHVRQLAGIITSPRLGPDGSLVFNRGYDPGSRLFMADDGVTYIRPPDSPTREDALKALDVLLTIIRDFPFAPQGCRSGWLAGLLTMIARPAIRGCVPIFLVRSNCPGVGKTMLIRIACIIADGRPAAEEDYSADHAEMEKRLFASCLAGLLVIVFGNLITGTDFGGGPIDRVSTTEAISGRVLQTSRMATVPNRLVIWAAGNNVGYTGDTARRVIPIDLKTNTERPDLRENFRIKNLEAHVKQERTRLLAAALTMLRAFVVNNYPGADKLSPFGSFDEWSRLIRGTLVWLGEEDPLKANLASRNNSDHTMKRLRLAQLAWGLMDPDRKGLTLAQVNSMLQETEEKKLPEELAEAAAALTEVCGKPPGEEPFTQRLGSFLKKVKNRFCDENCFVSEWAHKRVSRWRLNVVANGGDDTSSGGHPPASPPKPTDTSRGKGTISDRPEDVEDVEDVSLTHACREPSKNGHHAHTSKGKGDAFISSKSSNDAKGQNGPHVRSEDVPSRTSSEVGTMPLTSSNPADLANAGPPPDPAGRAVNSVRQEDDPLSAFDEEPQPRPRRAQPREEPRPVPLPPPSSESDEDGAPGSAPAETSAALPLEVQRPPTVDPSATAPAVPPTSPVPPAPADLESAGSEAEPGDSWVEEDI